MLRVITSWPGGLSVSSLTLRMLVVNPYRSEDSTCVQKLQTTLIFSPSDRVCAALTQFVDVFFSVS